MNTNIFLDSQEIFNAQKACSVIEDETTRNRAVANVLAGNIALSFFNDSIYSVDVISGLHNIPFVLKNIDISDIYINGSYIDVRFYFDGDTPSVPKSHFDNDILPVAYMFIKLNDELSEGVVSGFIAPYHVDKSIDQEGYYIVRESELVSFYDIENRIVTVDSEDVVTDEELFNFVDGNINQGEIYKKLILSVSARNRLAKIAKADDTYKFVSINVEELQNKIEDSGFSELINESDEMYSATDEAGKAFEDIKYTTVTTPNISAEDLDYVPEKDVSSEEQQNSEQIDTLFEQEQAEEFSDNQIESDNMDVEVPVVTKKRRSPLLWVLLLVVLGGAGYYGYTNFMPSEMTDDISDNSAPIETVNNTKNVGEAVDVNDAMPIETVENNTKPKNTEEAASVSIPAIENNLDTSILVSNLKIDWEVPSGYASNTSAKRYLIKLGKIIQLNLKTELLLLNRPPITNKITVEIKYNNSSKKFETVGILSSSGEKAVDDVIMQTVNKALNMSISVNTDSFNKLQGNPVLIIKL